ncbi:hypothetical protein ASE00_18685 [Sphingomonas sp. Root710]|nr:hypothetical protein ASE00_18685 [Sphingomonas sp. Root710]
MAAHLQPGDLVAVHLVGSVGKAQQPRIGERRCKEMVVAGAAAAEHLDRPVEDLLRHQRRGDLDHRDLLPRRLVADPVHHVGGLHRQQPGLFDHDARLGDVFQRYRLLRQRAAEGMAQCGAAAHPFEHPLGHADQPHAMVDAARPEPPLGDVETAAFAQQHIFGRHADIVEQHLRRTR